MCEHSLKETHLLHFLTIYATSFNLTSSILVEKLKMKFAIAFPIQTFIRATHLKAPEVGQEVWLLILWKFVKLCASDPMKVVCVIGSALVSNSRLSDLTAFYAGKAALGSVIWRARLYVCVE